MDRFRMRGGEQSFLASQLAHPPALDHLVQQDDLISNSE